MSRPADPRTKIDLLRAAEAVFAQHGLSSSKVEDITARAGVSKGAFYLHFGSKEECWKQILEGFLARLANCIEPAPEAADEGSVAVEDLLDRWHAHDLEVFEFCWDNKDLLRMVFEGSSGTPYAYLVDEFSERSRRLVEGWIRHGLRVGAYRSDIDVDVVSGLISGAYDRLARDVVRQQEKPDLGACCRQALELFSRGLVADGVRPLFVDRPVIDGKAGAPASGARVARGHPRKKEAVQGMKRNKRVGAS